MRGELSTMTSHNFDSLDIDNAESFHDEMNPHQAMDDISEKNDAAQMLISLSPSREPRNSSHMSPDLKFNFNSPAVNGHSLFASPMRGPTSLDFGTPLPFGTPSVNYEMSPFTSYGTMLSPLPAVSSSQVGRAQSSSSALPPGSPSAGSFFTQPNAQLQTPITSSIESGLVDMLTSYSPVAFSFPIKSEDKVADRKRTKSVITPESRQHCDGKTVPGSAHQVASSSQSILEPAPWIKVKVSPSSSLVSSLVDWGERHEFSQAMKVINDKFNKGDNGIHEDSSHAEDLFDLPSPPLNGRRHGMRAGDEALEAELSISQTPMISPPRGVLMKSETDRTTNTMVLDGSKAPPPPPHQPLVITQRRPCNCKNSKCLKLYCDCFAVNRFCAGCNCRDCNNDGGHEEERKEAMKTTLEKNPHAFSAKISKTGGVAQCELSVGCNCVKSKCLKKYCECFQGALYCGEKCKCLECENFEGSTLLQERKLKIRDNRKMSKPFSSKTEELGTTTTLKLDLENEAQTLTLNPLSQRPQTITSVQAPPILQHQVQQHQYHAQHLPQYQAEHFQAQNQPQFQSLPTVPTPGLALNMPFEATVVAAPETSAPTQTPPVSKRKQFEGQHILSGLPETRPLMIGIFQFLSDGDLHSSSLVCKLWLTTAFDPALWEYDNDAHSPTVP